LYISPSNGVQVVRQTPRKYEQQQGEHQQKGVRRNVWGSLSVVVAMAVVVVEGGEIH